MIRACWRERRCGFEDARVNVDDVAVDGVSHRLPHFSFLKCGSSRGEFQPCHVVRIAVSACLEPASARLSGAKVSQRHGRAVASPTVPVSRAMAAAAGSAATRTSGGRYRAWACPSNRGCVHTRCVPRTPFLELVRARADGPEMAGVGQRVGAVEDGRDDRCFGGDGRAYQVEARVVWSGAAARSVVIRACR